MCLLELSFIKNTNEKIAIFKVGPTKKMLYKLMYQNIRILTFLVRCRQFAAIQDSE